MSRPRRDDDDEKDVKGPGKAGADDPQNPPPDTEGEVPDPKDGEVPDPRKPKG